LSDNSIFEQKSLDGRLVNLPRTVPPGSRRSSGGLSVGQNMLRVPSDGAVISARMFFVGGRPTSVNFPSSSVTVAYSAASSGGHAIVEIGFPSGTRTKNSGDTLTRGIGLPFRSTIRPL